MSSQLPPNGDSTQEKKVGKSEDEACSLWLIAVIGGILTWIGAKVLRQLGTTKTPGG